MSRRDLWLVFLIPFVLIAIIAMTVTIGGSALLATINTARTSWGMDDHAAKLLVVPVGLSFMLVIGVLSAIFDARARRGHG